MWRTPNASLLTVHSVSAATTRRRWPVLSRMITSPVRNFNARTLATLIEEFAAVRRATVQLCKHFTGEEWQRRGTANEREITARAVAYNIAGHELHHVDALRSRYLVA